MRRLLGHQARARTGTGSAIRSVSDRQAKALSYLLHRNAMEKAMNRTKSQLRAKVKHVFGVIKRVFGFKGAADRPEFDSWEAHGGVWSGSRLRQNKYLRVREGRFEPKRLDTWISESCLPTARVDEYYWIHVLA